MKPPSPRVFGAALLGVVALLAWLLWPTHGPETPSPTPGTKRISRTGMMAAGPLRASAPEQNEALENLLADKPFVLIENGRPQRFRLSLHEVFVPNAAVGQRIREIAPQPNASSLIAQAQQMAAGQSPGWVLYPEGGKEDPALRRILGARILLKANDPDAVRTLLARHGLRLVDAPSYAPGYLIAETVQGGPAAALEALKALSREPAIESASPLLLHQPAKKLVPNDPLYAQEWHLKNTGQGGGKVGTDINVLGPWDTYQGEGVRIAILDDGLDLLHPDLAANADTANHYDWNDNPPDTNPAPSQANEDFHGTAVGGTAAARGSNGIGVSGVAPMATLVGFRLIAGYTADSDDGEAMTLHNDVIDIKNSSWGHSDGFPWLMYSPGPLMEAGKKAAATSGRGGLGTILVWAAGNGRSYGDQGNKDSYSNSMYSVNVGALTNTGNLATYSETGAHLTVVAPTSGGSRDILTTDLRGIDGYNDGATSGELADTNYTNDFGGTSASTPIVSGVIALILQANPTLNWRDVKEILLRSATKVFPTDAGWTTRTGGDSPTLPFIKHHHSYGGGLVNVQAAVQLAQGWTSLGAVIEDSRTQTWNSPPLTIPDNNTTGIDVPLDFSGTPPMRVENVTVRLNIVHSYRGDLQITLRSPAGVVSTLATKETRDDGEDYYDWNFSSMRHWGESSQGTWVLSVKDQSALDEGNITSAKITLYGSDAAPVEITSPSTPSMLLEEGQSLSLTATTTGYGYINHQWQRNGVVIGSAADYQVASAATTHAGRYLYAANNLTGSATGDEVLVGVVKRLVSPVTVNEGASIVLKTVAAGPGLTFQWYQGDVPLTNDARITGAQSDTLTIKNAAAADDTTYFCRLVLPPTNLTMDTLPAAVTVRLKPVVIGPAMAHGVVSGTASYLFSADNGATKFAAAGVPAGMTFNTKDGTFSGRPTIAGTYTIKVTATNAAGVSPSLVSTWTVEAFPLLARGTFSGLVGRQAGLNGGLGGRLKVVVASTGTLSGTLTLGAKSHALTGRISALPGNVDQPAQLTIVRPKPLPPLTVQFTLGLTDGSLVGTVSDGTDTADITARRNPWSYTNKAADYAGAYNAFLQATSGVEASPDYPHGEGYAKLTTTLTGTATWAGKLADGTALTGGTTLGPAGEVPLHLMLYTNTGSVQGWSAITPGPALLDGEFDWVKNPQVSTSTTRYYKDGFALHTLTLIGNKYTKPALNTPVLGLPAPTPGQNNARLDFTSGALDAELLQDLTITTANAVKMPTGALNPKLVRLTLNATTGLINGAFTLKDNNPTDMVPPIAVVTRTGTFSGALITREGYNQGRGQFVLATLPSLGPPKTTPYTSPILSGQVILQALPP
ncbi:MAG: S8 family serine peptidase [Prosthecobacter sp.]|nr:S8 family serine peptidase [Prosthecobacter sp.]